MAAVRAMAALREVTVAQVTVAPLGRVVTAALQGMVAPAQEAQDMAAHRREGGVHGEAEVLVTGRGRARLGTEAAVAVA